MLEISYRVMEIGDLAEVMRIEKESFPTPWSPDLFVQELTSGFSGTLVADEGNRGRLIGYVCYQRFINKAHITNIAVGLQYRRMGIGESMIRQVLEIERSKGISVFSLEVRMSNVAAQSMYEKIGFAATNVKKRYYSDNGEDAQIMTLEDLR